MAYETANWPYVPARDQVKWTGLGRRPVDEIVIHAMQAPEKVDTAENVGKYFQNPDYPSSAHIGVDSNSIVQYVKDNNVAYGAKGYNQKGIHIELAGYIEQTRLQWLDPFGISMLALASDAAAQYCLKYSIPPVHITDTELRDGVRGIVGHDQITRVFKKSDHTDPGQNFPWDYFMASVKAFYNVRKSHA